MVNYTGCAITLYKIIVYLEVYRVRRGWNLSVNDYHLGVYKSEPTLFLGVI